MTNSRSKRAMVSSVVALLLEIITTVSGLIIPRLILSHFGSEVNGMVSSITQFLGYVSLLQLGVGGVIRAALYKPLADGDTKQISRVVKAADQFFGKIAIISIFYIVTLSIIYPFISNSSFGYLYALTLVIILGLDTIAQYAWGFSNRQLLYADQRSYLYDISRVISISLNVLLTVLLIKMGCEIHIVKLGSAIVFVLQPYILNRYVIKRYGLIKKIEPDNEAVKQRWAGVGYSLADFVHRKTDIFVLTILSSLKEVSVYSIYSIVINGVNSVISMATGSFQAALGDMLARNEEKTLNNTMHMYEFIVHSLSAIVFSTTMCLIVPFVEIYTSGINDVSYSRPVFAIIIVIAEMMYCLRQPYQNIILAAGHFKQTQRGAIIEAVLNMVVSIILVKRYGIVGVAIGTFIGMLYRTVDLLVYLKRNIIRLQIGLVIKRYVTTIFQTAIVYILYRVISPNTATVWVWIVVAIVVVCCSSALVLGMNFLLFKNEFFEVFKKVKSTLLKR